MEKVFLICPICKNNKFKLGIDIFDDRYGEPNQYKLSSCLKCNHISTFPRLKEEELSNLYSKYYPRKDTDISEIVRNSQKVKRKISAFKRWLQGVNNQGQYLTKPNDKILDIGCGDCQSLIEAKLLGATVYGVDPDVNIKNISRRLSINVHIGSITEDIFPGVKFNLIILNQVLEHIPDPNKLIKILSKKLSSNGKIFISSPNVNSFYRKLFNKKWINWHIPYHLNHFNKENLKKMFKSNNLKILSYRTVTPNCWTIIQLRNIFASCKKGEENLIWKNSRKVNSKNNRLEKLTIKRLFLKILKAFLIPFITIFNRYIDLIGAGDSLVFILKK